MTDAVNHPPHYQSDTGLEAIDVIEAFFLNNAFLANVFKYIARAGKKGDYVENLLKAQWYLQREIDRTTPPTVTSVANWTINVGPTPEKPEPRVWDFVEWLPPGVAVTDKSGDNWRWDEHGDLKFRFKNDAISYGVWFDPEAYHIDPEQYAPFTEVLDG
jgi:hypothetical protein